MIVNLYQRRYKSIMTKYPEEHDLLIMKALTEYNILVHYKIGEYEKYPAHCEFWCNEAVKSKAAVKDFEKYLTDKGL